MDRTFSPCALSGVAAVPPSKSEAHRRMICAALTPGETRLTGFLPSRDMTATMDCLSALGASFRLEGETLLVRGCGGRAVLANSITLTAGTITVETVDGRFCVHALDRSLAEGIEDCEFQRRLEKLEE